MNNKKLVLIETINDLWDCEEDEKVDNKEIAIKKCHEVFSWSKEHGKLPKSKSKNEIERKYGIWILNKRQARIFRGESIFYSEYLTIAAECGFSNAFDIIDFKTQTISMAYAFFEWINYYNRLPKNNSKDSIEKKYAQWLSHQRKAKLGFGTYVWYIELDTIAIEYGYANIFNIIDLKQKAIKKCHEVFKWKDENGYLPKKYSENKTEKSLGEWIYKMRGAKKGVGKSVWYSELDIIAAEHGFPDLFNPQM